MRQIPNQVGEHIQEVVERALVVAEDGQEPVQITFNGVTLTVSAGEDKDALVTRYRRAFQETKHGMDNERRM